MFAFPVPWDGQRYWRGQVCEVRVCRPCETFWNKTGGLAMSDVFSVEWSATEFGVIVLSQQHSLHCSSRMARGTERCKLYSGQGEDDPPAVFVACSQTVLENGQKLLFGKVHWKKKKSGIKSKYCSQYFDAFDPGKVEFIYICWAQDALYCWLVLTFLRNSSTVPETSKESK